MGRHSYGDPTVMTYGSDGSRVTVGAFCSIAVGVTFTLGGGHRTDWITQNPNIALGIDRPPGHPPRSEDIVIGNDVWIARDARIFGGVTIGDGAVVGSCAVVASDVEPYAVVVGNPARRIRRRFDDRTCEALLDAGWWDWSDETIREALPLLWSSDLDGFLRFAEKHP